LEIEKIKSVPRGNSLKMMWRKLLEKHEMQKDSLKMSLEVLFHMF